MNQLKVIANCCVVLLSLALLAAESEKPAAPATDRVGFPKNYQKEFQILRVVNRDGEKPQVVTVYGNARASSVNATNDLPYPNGSVLVMETAAAATDASSKPQRDAKGFFQRGEVLGLHVMRREKGFGEAYGPNRTAEWEYVEYRADGSHLTPPQKSAACAECHVKAGAKKDFVYQARLGEK